MKTNEKGVTLVALVTVITIMLILIVASTYTVFDNNGLLKMAQKEKFISSVKMIQQKLEVSINEVKNNETYNVYGINTNTINAKNIINEIDSELSEKIDVVCGEVYFIGTDTTEIEWAREAGIKISGEIILEPTYIPEGFRKLDSVSLDNLFEGYVITDEPSGGEGGNEYVWVPVIGKIKRENSPILSDSVGKADCKDDVDEFIQSVELYKGFYVARYEAGVPNSASSSFQNSYTSTQAPESKKGLIPWTNVSYDNAKEKAQLVRNNSADFVKSDLMNSYAWDTIMKWVEANNFDVNGNSSNWGNRLDSTFSFTGNCARINSNSLTHTTGVTTKPQNQAFLIRTGNATSNESNNIYDLSGNASEWTTEFLRDNINTHILRGGTGETQGIVPANVRISSNNTSVSKGFRVILYMTGKSSHNEIGGVCHSPQINSGSALTPVYYDEGTNRWIELNELSTTEQWNNWYDYENKKWANAKTSDGSMWVWIPRFEYKINSNDKSIDVNFIEIGQEATPGYTIHPAFRDGTSIGFKNGEWDKEIQGFWVAKYEAGFQNSTVGEEQKAVSYSNLVYTSVHEDYKANWLEERITVGTTRISYPVFKANTYSYNMISAGDAWSISREISSAFMYGLSGVDSHMIKNSEWGALAYLTHSRYGLNGNTTNLNEVAFNSKEIYNILVNVPGTTILSNVHTITSYGSENFANDVRASSTQNMTGVFDMSGGLWDRVSVFRENGAASNPTNYSSFSTNTSTKYVTVYTQNPEDETGATTINDKIGDAIQETSGWNSDRATNITKKNPIFVRGGSYDSNIPGIFAYSNHSGHPWEKAGFRVVLIND